MTAIQTAFIHAFDCLFQSSHTSNPVQGLKIPQESFQDSFHFHSHQFPHQHYWSFPQQIHISAPCLPFPLTEGAVAMLHENGGPFLGFLMTLSGDLNISKTAGPGIWHWVWASGCVTAGNNHETGRFASKHLESIYCLSSDIIYNWN